MSLKPAILSSISLSMELSRTSVISTARILPHPFSRFGENIRTISIPTKIPCNSKRCSHSDNHIPVLSKLHSDKSSSNLFYQPKSTLPNGRKAIPLVKANGDQIGQNKYDCSPLIKVLKFSEVVLRFMRLPAIFGVVVVFIGIMTRTWIDNTHLVVMPKWILFLRAIAVLVARVSTSCFITGINQIYDIEIDKINKRHYSLASGELSVRSAWIIVISCAAMSIAIPVLLQFQSLFASNICCFVLASIYSIPPVSTKRSTILAPLTCAALWCTSTVGMAATARNIMGLSFQLSTPSMFITIFTTLFVLALGALKDIEDLEGDEKYNVPTLASIYGPKKVAFFGFGLLLLTYAGAIATATLMPQVFRPSVMVPTHVIIATYLIIKVWKLEKANYSKEASKLISASLWKLVNIEFILFPFI